MKKEQKTNPELQDKKKTGKGSNPENEFKKGQTTSVAAIDNIITSAVESVKPKSGSGFTDEGTVVFYDEER